MKKQKAKVKGRTLDGERSAFCLQLYFISTLANYSYVDMFSHILYRQERYLYKKQSAPHLTGRSCEILFRYLDGFF